MGLVTDNNAHVNRLCKVLRKINIPLRKDLCKAVCDEIYIVLHNNQMITGVTLIKLEFVTDNN